MQADQWQPWFRVSSPLSRSWCLRYAGALYKNNLRSAPVAMATDNACFKFLVVASASGSLSRFSYVINQQLAALKAILSWPKSSGKKVPSRILFPYSFYVRNIIHLVPYTPLSRDAPASFQSTRPAASCINMPARFDRPRPAPYYNNAPNSCGWPTPAETVRDWHPKTALGLGIYVPVSTPHELSSSTYWTK